MSEVKGAIQKVFETVQVSDKFKKRDFVLNTGGEYPQEVFFQLTQDKCDLIDKFGVGQEVTVSYNLRGRSWTNPQGETKYFNTLESWKIESEGQAPPLPPLESAPDDDLPF